MTQPRLRYGGTAIAMIERILQQRAIHDRNSRFTRKLEIEVTAYYNRQIRARLMNVRNNLS
jgi:hypothetical protein